MLYTFRIDGFQIFRTRAVFTDTDVLGLLLRVGDNTYPPVMRALGDVKDGNHSVDVAIGPVDIPNDSTPVVLSYSIVNKANEDVAEAMSAIRFILNAFADMGGQTVPFGLGSLINDFLMFPFHNMVFSGCDGMVVADAISLTGRSLASWTASNNPLRETRRYPGRLHPVTPEYNSMYTSPGTCGDTSDYSVTWSVESVLDGTGQRVLTQRPTLIALSGYMTVDDDEHVVTASSYPGRRPPPVIINGLTMSLADGRAVHDGEEPMLSVDDLQTMCAYQAGLEQHLIIARTNGDLYFGRVPLAGSSGHTHLDQKPFASLPGVTALAGTASFGDHVFAGLQDGTIHHAMPPDASGQAWSLEQVATVGAGRHIAALGTYESGRDGYLHVVVACDDGDVLDIRLSPDKSNPEPVFQDVRAFVNRAVAIAGYFSEEDGYHHVFVARSDGEIREVWYPGVATAGQGGTCVRAQFNGIIAIAAYRSAGDKREHIVAGLGDTTIREVIWSN